MRAVTDHRKGNIRSDPGCREGARTRRKIRESWRTRFPFRFSNPAAQNVFHDPGHLSAHFRRSDPLLGPIRTNDLAICKLELDLRSVSSIQQVNLSRLTILAVVARCS